MTRDGGSGGPQWIGILGGGQLGRMLAIAATQLGLKTHIYAPDADTSPAGEVATRTTTAARPPCGANVPLACSLASCLAKAAAISGEGAAEAHS